MGRPDLAPEVRARIQRTAKRIYRTLGLDGYARIDFRLSADGTRISLKRTPIPKSRRAKSSLQRPGMTDLITRTCCIAFWRSE